MHPFNPFKAASVAAALGVVAVAALITGEFIVKRYSPYAVPAREAGVSPVVAAASPSDFSLNEKIPASGLFGKGAVSLMGEAPGGNKEARAESIGDLLLLGTIVNNSGPGYAIFKTAESKQTLFERGERVFDAGVLKAVERDRVLLEAGGRVVTVFLPGNRPPKGEALERQGAASAGAPFISSITDTSRIIDRKALSGILSDMDKVLTDARLLPYSEGGKIKGFRVSEARPDGLLRLIGINNNDILVKINDYPIDSPEKGVQVLSGLRGESSITVDLLRGGKPLRLNYMVR